jgi:hypothetical protein
MTWMTMTNAAPTTALSLLATTSHAALANFGGAADTAPTGVAGIQIAQSGAWSQLWSSLDGNSRDTDERSYRETYDDDDDD